MAKNPITQEKVVHCLTFFRKILFQIVGFVEIVVAAMIIIAIVIHLIDIFKSFEILHSPDGLMSFMELLFDVLIGIELVKLLCRNDLHTLVEVLMFAVSRHIILEHLTMPQILLGIVAMVGLFATRKFLFRHPETREQMLHRREYID